MNQLVFFGAESSPDDFKAWASLRFDEGEIAYRLESGPIADLAAMPLRAAVDRLTAELRATAGVAVVLSQGLEGAVVVHTFTSQPKKVSAPRTLMRLTCAGLFEFKKIGDTGEWPLAEWDAVVVPVSLKVEKALDAFMRAATDLPPSSRSAVFFQLTLPTLESRVARLEQLEAYAKTRIVPGGPTQRWFQRRGAWRAVAMIAVLMFASATCFLATWFLWSQMMQRLATIEARLPQASGAPGGTPSRLATADPAAAAAKGASESTSHLLPDQSTVSFEAGSAEEQLLDALRDDRAGKFVLEEVRFNGTNVDTTAESGKQLRTIGIIIRAFPDAIVKIVGLGERSMSGDARDAAKRRALAIEDELIAQGVRPDQLRTGIRGESADEQRARKQRNQDDQIWHAELQIVTNDRR